MNFKDTIFFGKKKFEYYKGLLIRADTGLHEQIVHTLESKLKKGATVLDMGAGQGALSARLSDSGFKVTAVDSNDEDYALAGQSIEYFNVNFDDASDLEKFVAKNEARFDAVCGIEVIEHVENPWVYVRGLARMAKNGGVILVTTPNINSWLSRFEFLIKGQFLCFGESNLEYGHINPISNFELNLIMTRTGLKNVEVNPAGTLPPLYITSPSMLVKSLVGLLLRPFQRGELNGWCVIAIGVKQ